MVSAPKTAQKAASQVQFPTWDDFVAESTVDKPPYQLPLSKDDPDDVIEIPIPNGEQYLSIVRAQRTGDAVALFEWMFPTKELQERMKIKMRGVHYPIIDVISGNVLSYYYGIPLQVEADKGNSPAS